MAVQSRQTDPQTSPPRLQGWRSIAWPRVLVWVMRVLSIAWLFKGLLGWASILGVPLLSGGSFELEPASQQAVTVAFAIIDLVAAIGLWLTTSWGGVMWIFAVMSGVIAGVLSPMAGGGILHAVLSAILVAAYLALSWLASREPDAT
jgi:hypothetical protein